MMNNDQGVVERPDRWVMNLGGWVVTRCAIDYAFTLGVSKGKELVSVRIGGCFVLNAGEEEQVLDPERGAPVSLCPALRILHQTVDSALAYKDGTLGLRFSDGTRITAPPGIEHEAWEAAGGEGGLLIVSLPGGGVSVWKPRPRNAAVQDGQSL
jgi:hypothetical protein